MDIMAVGSALISTLIAVFILLSSLSLGIMVTLLYKFYIIKHINKL
jgi:hypothetical protein